jgi:type II secretory pathway predicted ATPase ExeA
VSQTQAQTPPALDLRSHFGLTEIPFTREISVQQRWPASHLDEVRADLARVVDQRQSAVVCAPAGSGKTSVLRAVCADLPEARYRVHYVKVTSLSKRDMTREIALASGVAPAGSFPSLFRRLQERFESIHNDDGIRPVLILDEAHDLRPEVLAVVRLITNFHMDSRLVSSASTTPAGARQLLLPVSARGRARRGDLAGAWIGARGSHPRTPYSPRCWGGDGT